MLSTATCVPCSGSEQPLTKSEITSYLEQLSQPWVHVSSPDRIQREINFQSFMDAVEFINVIAKIAEEEGHHPNLSLHDYNKVMIELYTHKIKGLHKNDFILAAKINKAYREDVS